MGWLIKKTIIDNSIENQKRYFQSGYTLSIKFRIEMLRKLYNAIEINKEKILNA